MFFSSTPRIDCLMLLVALTTQASAMLLGAAGAAVAPVLKGAACKVGGDLLAAAEKKGEAIIEDDVDEVWGYLQTSVNANSDWKKTGKQIEVTIKNRTTDKIIEIERTDAGKAFYFFKGKQADIPITSTRMTKGNNSKAAGPGEILTLALTESQSWPTPKYWRGISGGLTAKVKDYRTEWAKEDQPTKFDDTLYMNAAFKHDYSVSVFRKNMPKKLDAKLSTSPTIVTTDHYRSAEEILHRDGGNYVGVAEYRECEQIHWDMWSSDEHASESSSNATTKVDRRWGEEERERGRYILTTNGNNEDKYYRVRLEVDDHCQFTELNGDTSKYFASMGRGASTGIHYTYIIEEMNGLEGQPVLDRPATKATPPSQDTRTQPDQPEAEQSPVQTPRSQKNYQRPAEENRRLRTQDVADAEPTKRRRRQKQKQTQRRL